MMREVTMVGIQLIFFVPMPNPCELLFIGTVGYRYRHGIRNYMDGSLNWVMSYIQLSRTTTKQGTDHSYLTATKLFRKITTCLVLHNSL